MKKIIILISNTGTGTNLSAIIEAIKKGTINAEIVSVISDTIDAKGLIHAKKNSLPIEVVSKKEELLKTLKKYNPDYICMCGWKQFITEDVIDYYTNNILNLHPGAIPDSLNGNALNPDGTNAEWNKGKLTNVAIQNVLNQKNTYASSSIHFLSPEFDFGTVLDRCFEKTYADDTIDSLYSRLKVKENKMYVGVLQKLCK